MARTDVLDYIFDQIKNQTTIYALLGPATSTNFVLYRQYPQQQPTLASGEPPSGWLTYDIDGETLADPATIFETLGLCFYLFTTRASLADQVIDQLDSLWQFRLPQQKDIQMGERLLLMSKRVKTVATYQEAVHLYRRDVYYAWQCVKEEAEP